MLVEFGGDKADEKSALEAHKKAVVQQLQIQPLVNLMIPYVHDIWIELPILFGFECTMFKGIGSLVKKTKTFRDLVMNSLP